MVGNFDQKVQLTHGAKYFWKCRNRKASVTFDSLGCPMGVLGARGEFTEFDLDPNWDPAA